MYKYEIIIAPNDEGGYYARIPDIPSIFTGGVSEEDALKNAREAIDEYIRICQEEGLPIPEPKDYSGKFNVRIPKTLHRILSEMAEEEGVSLNYLIVTILSLGSKPLVFQVNPPMPKKGGKRRGKRRSYNEPFLVG